MAKGIMEKFTKSYRSLIAERTMVTYKKRLSEILEDNISVTGKSKYLQYKAVIHKLNEIGIDLNVKLPKYCKRGDTIKQNIIDKYVSPEQLETILDAANDTEKGKELRLAMQLSYFSGLRMEEVLTLNKSDIILNGHIGISVSGKGSKSRKVYLPKDKMNLISDFQGFTITEGYVTKSVEIISERTGVKFSFHSLRHSFASNFVRNGGNIVLLQKLMGHSKMTTTAVYLHCIDDTAQLREMGF